MALASASFLFILLLVAVCFITKTVIDNKWLVVLKKPAAAAHLLRTQICFW
jgi:hypothetical protein